MPNIPQQDIDSATAYLNNAISSMNSAKALLVPAAPPAASATWDPTGVANSPVFSNGNLTATSAGNSLHLIRSSVSHAISKRYAEIVIGAVGGAVGYVGVGLIRDTQSISSPPYSAGSIPGGLWVLRDDGLLLNGGGYAPLSGGNFLAANRIGIYTDENGNAWFRKNGTWLNGGNPDTGAAPHFTGLTGNIGLAVCFMGAYTGMSVTLETAAPTGSLPTGAQLY
jgi:hypothetical protein